MLTSSGDERTPAKNEGHFKIEPKEAINGDIMDDIM